MAKERTKAKDPRKQRLDEEREEFRRLAETHDPKLREKIITDHLHTAQLIHIGIPDRHKNNRNLVKAAKL